MQITKSIALLINRLKDKSLKQPMKFLSHLTRLFTGTRLPWVQAGQRNARSDTASLAPQMRFGSSFRDRNTTVATGAYTYGVENISIRQWGEGASLKIGKFCSIAADVTVFLGGNHRTDWITTFPFGHVFQSELGAFGFEGHPSTRGDVEIGNDVWIGEGVTIMSGVKIGDGAVLAANSTVVRHVMPYRIVGGNPAQVIKTRFADETVEALLNLKWWDLRPEKIREIAPLLCSAPTRNLLEQLTRVCSEARKD